MPLHDESIYGDIYKLNYDDHDRDLTYKVVQLLESRLAHYENVSTDKSSKRIAVMAAFSIAMELKLQEERLENVERLVEEIEGMFLAD